jgi:DNA-binding MarR family transcriptional regulator
MGEALKKRLRQERFQSPAHEAMLNLFVAADYLHQRMEQTCSGFGITPAQFNVLRILRGAHPGGYPRCDVIRRMVERAPDVTRLVDKLEAQRLVLRDRSDDDRRLSITRIAPAGLELLEKMEPEIARLSTFFAERVSRRDCRELSRICEGIYGEEE